jgi:hypothetical protein
MSGLGRYGIKKEQKGSYNIYIKSKGGFPIARRLSMPVTGEFKISSTNIKNASAVLNMVNKSLIEGKAIPKEQQKFIISVLKGRKAAF